MSFADPIPNPPPVDADGDGYEIWFDCDDNNAAVYPGALEFCDGVDNNCDGNVDLNAVVLPWYIDDDMDGFGSTNVVAVTCQPIPGTTLTPGDCDDTQATTHPAASEVCDLQDNDCDGLIDEELDCECVDLNGDGLCDVDQDEDGFLDADDCDDADPETNPGIEERCDGLDNNCNGQVDEDIPCPRDADQDGFFDDVDCDDTEALVNPGAEERCGDGIDNDCDGSDEPCAPSVEPTATPRPDESIRARGCASGEEPRLFQVLSPFLRRRSCTTR
jgi:hypothetical protein